MPLHRVAAAALSITAALASAEPPRDPRPDERGFPIARSFDEAQHGGGHRNFGVAADGRGRIYVANLRGLLIFDGARWRIVAPGATLTAVGIGLEGEVVAGGPRSLVHLAAGPRGEPVLRSLLGASR